MNCQHSRGKSCAVCKAGCNSCCGDDVSCPTCSSEFCLGPCSKDVEEGICPVCTGKLVSSDDIVEYIVKKNNVYFEQTKHTISTERRKAFEETLADIRYIHIHKAELSRQPIAGKLKFALKFSSEPTNAAYDMVRLLHSAERGLFISVSKKDALRLEYNSGTNVQVVVKLTSDVSTTDPNNIGKYYSFKDLLILARQ